MNTKVINIVVQILVGRSTKSLVYLAKGDDTGSHGILSLIQFFTTKVMHISSLSTQF